MLSATIISIQIDVVHADGNARARFPLNYNNNLQGTSGCPRVVLGKSEMAIVAVE
ncbi:hypothetical protein V0288_13985 [Pannus brasiliensis CCIBt3594]|uniref:Uncharacterized protein n=1 Tax=Pannus brasiliensis CCIBt3594 TaxID=1427578 RepID=A0AAW9QSN5_9CHRO